MSDNYCLFDIDGTLCGSRNQIKANKKFKETLENLSATYSYGIVTGRTHFHLLNFLKSVYSSTSAKKHLGDFEIVVYEGGHLSSQGGVKKKHIGQDTFKELSCVRNYIEKLYGKYGNEWIDNSGNLIHVDFPNKKFFGEIIFGISQINFIEQKRGLYKMIDQFINKQQLKNIQIVQVNETAVVISSKEASKLRAVTDLGVDLSLTTFFCDEFNDIALAKKIISSGGTVVTPRNAIRELKNISSYVSDKKNIGGVIDYLNKRV